MYAELSYFEGYHFKHLADWQEHQRLEAIERTCRRNRMTNGATAWRSSRGATNPAI